MASLDWTRTQLSEVAKDNGLHVRTWSPGDGITRYRFFTDGNNDYFGPDNGIYTALGLAEARTFVRAWQLCERG
ncbi:hypothetical protein LCGC14_2059490 [marine sediment metagenome]|uniref:Uncharacterized protein n=1 Tax=marine sediment metagenome TaxID=412755 RepID=A0A0F9H041_9ZZZZ